MWLITSINGLLPSKGEAARRAAVLQNFDGVDDPFESDEPPPPQQAETGHRNAPIKRCFKNGYTECTLSPKPGRATSLKPAAKRLARKHRDWTKPDRPERDWIVSMAHAWAATVFPQVMRGTGLDPVGACLAAASRVGERPFAERYLLPLLKDQEASAGKQEVG